MIVDNYQIDLTNSDIELLKYISAGLTSEEIALKTFVTIHAVNIHRRRLINKLELNSGKELVKYAIIHFPEEEIVK